MRKIKRNLVAMKLRAMFAVCWLRAKWRVKRQRALWPYCAGALAMAWPTTGAGSEAAGILFDGKTTIRWGTMETVTSIAGVAINGTNVGVVVSIVQARINNMSLLPNGDGVSITRVNVLDGVEWDVTIRDDTGITGFPEVGAACIVVDMAGYLGTIGTTYSTKVVQSSYHGAAGKEGERVFKVQRLILVDTA